MTNPETEATGVAGCFARLFWMLGGLALLALVSIWIYDQHSFSFRDLGFWALILSLVLVRYADIRYLHGYTAEGKPATMTHWRRYSVGLLAGALGLWLVLHGVSHFTK